MHRHSEGKEEIGGSGGIKDQRPITTEAPCLLLPMRAGKGEIGRAIIAPMLLGNDVLDVECGEGHRVLGQQAVFAKVPRSLPNKRSSCRIHYGLGPLLKSCLAFD